MRNGGGTTRFVASIAFRAMPETGRDSAASWRYEITRRTVDSLPPGQSATFGLTVSPGSMASGATVDGVYRIEGVLGDSTTGRRTLPLGRIRLRSPRDST